MAIALRLSRGGAKKRPYYRIVAADSRSARDGKYLEQIGTYNPLLAKDDEKRVVLNEDRARYWLGVGAQPSDRVLRFLDAAGIKERPARNNPKKGEPGEAAKLRAEERAAKEAEAAEAAQAAAEEASAPAEEEVTEAPAEAAAEAPAEASTDQPAEGAEAPATGDEASVEASSDEPVEGSEEVVAEAEKAAEEAPAEEAAAEEKSEG